MKRKMKRNELVTNDDIWNAVIDVISNYNFPSDNCTKNKLYIGFQYYSELESGGHESLYTWFSEYIEEAGITTYLNELISFLETIDAQPYAKIEKKYGEQAWRLYKALEAGDIEEDDFYNVIEKADHEYYNLNDKLGKLLEAYFLTIYPELIEVIDD